jgi:PAS domain S-box-containing protein
LRVLYVEDNAFDADLARRALRADPRTAAAELDIASTCGEAQARLASGRHYDIALVDLNLPDGSGMDLIPLLRARQDPPAVVALTGCGDEKVALAVLKAGADDYLPKTLELPQRLAPTLLAALERFRADTLRHALKLQVLYVEHDAADIEPARRHFERHAPHLQLTAVPDAAAVWARLPASSDAPGAFDILLLDYQPDGDTGLDVLKALRVDRGLDLPVVLITRQGSDDVAAQAMRLGANGYVVKRHGYLAELPWVLENAYHRVSMVREQNALRRSEQRLNLMLKGSKDVAWDVSIGGHDHHVSQRLWQLLGMAERSTAPDAQALLDLLHAEERDRLVQGLHQMLDSEAREVELEMRLRHAQGHYLPVLARGFISRDAAGRAVRMSGTFTDMSERKRVESELLQANASLDMRVRARTRELEAALDHLRQTQHELVRTEKLASLGALVAGVAHELNTPIGNAVMVASTLAGWQQELEQGSASDMAPLALQKFLSRSRQACDVLQRNLQRAAELVGSFKQLAVDQSSYQRRSFELRALVQEVALSISPTLRNSGTRLQQAVPAGLCMDSYPGPLGQVLINLVNNAVVHAFEGRAPGTVRVAAERLEGGHVRLLVSDDGRGIPAQFVDRIFDPFFTTRLGHGGSGLGLHISHTLVYGPLAGRMEVQTAPAGGTAFVIDLSLVAPAAASTAAA